MAHELLSIGRQEAVRPLQPTATRSHRRTDDPAAVARLNGITVVGSIVGTRLDLREVFELHAAGRTRVITETRSLGDVNEAIADVEARRVPARIVFTPERVLA